MPKISFSFSGWVRDAEINEVTINNTGETLCVSGRNASEVAAKLESGEWSISLCDHLYDSDKSEIEIFDFDAD